jgi:hypothetical protein
MKACTASTASSHKYRSHRVWLAGCHPQALVFPASKAPYRAISDDEKRCKATCYRGGGSRRGTVERAPVTISDGERPPSNAESLEIRQ